ncbi:hypothetical protein K493DRAFT_318892 [Basidiobolus meristosporus CBS 931.73]|uniref:PH domain-containing protein n=1 Tax=Basidiobolus meristosporus CBS 931.73 TaxID=1314790 RepID=A0A1Y1XTV8_9FUNG|nr:hypothetical protein K493DRAFT_318892 [Basidiobolus meristosporus CBS 931.73]|eukprot:ORX89189.1 hypothetical protein K493DRAFT_318892 [Basidiobolus meristosporus CBS 931.73]
MGSEEGSELQYAMGGTPPGDTYFDDNLVFNVQQRTELNFYVRYVVKDVWRQLSFPRTETVAHAKQMCLVKCGITSQQNLSFPTPVSSSVSSDRDTENSDESLSTETDWTMEYGLFWPAAGHWLDDSRRLATYQFAPQDIIEVQQRNNFILLPMLNYFDSYAEGYLLKRCGRGLSHNWGLRWFCLRGKLICYSRKAKDFSSAVVHIYDPFLFMEESHFKSDEHSLQFSIQFPNKTLELKATTHQEFVHWRRSSLARPRRKTAETISPTWTKSTEVKATDHLAERNEPRARTKSLVSIFTKTSHFIPKTRRESNPVDTVPEQVMPVLRAYFQTCGEPESVYVGVKPKRLFIFKNGTHSHHKERTISLTNTIVEVEHHSASRLMFAFSIKNSALDIINTPGGTIGRLYVENEVEVKEWLTVLIEKAEVQVSFANIKPFISEIITSEPDDGYSASPPTTPTSLYGSDFTNFPFTASKHSIPNRQSLKDYFEELHTTTKAVGISNQLSEDTDISRSAPTPAPHCFNSHRITKKTSQRFPATFWKRRGSII